MFRKSKKRPKYKPSLEALSEADELKLEHDKAIEKIKQIELINRIHTLGETKSIHAIYDATPIDSTIKHDLYTINPKSASDFLNNNSTKYSSSDYTNNAGYKRKSKHYKPKHYKSKRYKNTNRKINRQFRRTIRRLNKKTKKHVI